MVKCSICGRELPGVEWECYAKPICAECSGMPTNAMWSVRGDKVKYSHPENGREPARKLAEKFLVPGDTYYVDTVKIYGSETHIKLQGLKYWFNSVLLERVP